MKFKSEYSDPQSIRRFVTELEKLTAQSKKKWKIMEVCGGQTHSIMKHGLDQLLPNSVELVHGPGCPVCVTPAEFIDKAIEICRRESLIFCTFGDMLRVRGTDADLLSAKAAGADIRIVYSVLDAVKLAKLNVDREVVFFAIGFETTAPANALAVIHAKQEGLRNFSLLVSHVRVPPAIEAILSSPTNQVQGFLAAGHVSAIMGFTEYEPISEKYHVPIVVTGFEPLDIMQGIYMLVQQLERGETQVLNQYTRSVTREGNLQAQTYLQDVFSIIPRHWRGLGEIPASGLGLNSEYRDFDAELRFGRIAFKPAAETGCRIGEVLRGELKPSQCEKFGKICTPENPLGATMVSAEGSCAAYYRYRGAL